MNIDIAIHSSDSNPLYLDFWESVSRAWKTKLGIEPVLIYIDHDYKTAAISEKYGKVVRMKPIPGIPLYVQCQTVRFWYATQLGDKTGIISDIDMYPLSKYYFKTQIRHIEKHKYVHLNPCISSYGQYPACYHVAMGSTFASVLGSYDFETYMQMAINYSNNVDTSNGSLTYWFVDERYSTMLITNHPDKSIFKFINRNGGECGHRIDRSAWGYSHQLVTNDQYYDAHSIIPFTDHETELNQLVDLMHDANFVDDYSTHIPVLEAAIEFIKPKTAIEFGPGNYSTSLFADSCNVFMTVEMQSTGWFDKIHSEYADHDNVSVISSISPHEFMYLKYPENPDIVFVDGHGDSRPGVINFFGGKCDTIITHDSEEAGYGWHRVNLPPDYVEYTVKKYPVYTTVYTKNTQLIDYIKSKNL